MNLVTRSGLSLKVKNLSFQVTNLFSGHAICNGFDLLTVNDAVSFSFEEYNEAAPAAQYVEINDALDEAAQKMADDELASALQDRHDYRALCHG